MKKRDLGESVEQKRFFEAMPSPKQDMGTRDMTPLLPFVISGGKNTERYYFVHISNLTDYKFKIIPEYFGDESNYTEVFPKRIKAILDKNADAKIFCVFDWDTVFDNQTNQEKHRAFESEIQADIDDGRVVLCPSMPSIEYWFLLHFKNHTSLIKDNANVIGILAPYMKDYFSSNKKLSKTLKRGKFIEFPQWVENLCSEGKLELAILRAESNINIAKENDDLDNQSYTFVYKLFKH